jgi:type I restriction enzyme, S subunit
VISRTSIAGGYPTRRLGEAVEFLDYLRRPIKESERKSGTYPYYGANGLQGTIDGYIFDEPLVLLAEDGGHFDDPDRGVAYAIFGKCWVNNHAHVLRAKPGLDLGFLRRVLENYDLSPFVSGTTRGKLTQAGAAQIPIPVPSLSEQRRISAILDQADELRTKWRQIIKLLNGLKQTVFSNMFGDLVSHKIKYETSALSDLAELINGDRSSNYPSGDDLIDEGILFLSTKNITGYEINLSECTFIGEKKFESLSRGKLKPHDLVITLRGTLGQCAEFECEYETGFINAQMMIIRPGKRLISKYLHAFLSHDRTQAVLKRAGSGSAIPQLTGKQIGELLVPVPPRAVQEEFARKLTHVRGLIFNSVTHLAKLNVLFASLQQRAFCGELTSEQVRLELEMAG